MLPLCLSDQLSEAGSRPARAERWILRAPGNKYESLQGYQNTTHQGLPPTSLSPRLSAPPRTRPTPPRVPCPSVASPPPRGSPCRCTCWTWSAVLIVRRGRYRRGTWCGRARSRSRRAGVGWGGCVSESARCDRRRTYAVFERDDDELTALEPGSKQATDVLGCGGEIGRAHV